MSKAKFSATDIEAAVAEFTTYMAPKIIAAGGKNGNVTVYGENPNERKAKPIIYDDEEDDGLLQKLSDSNFGDE